jgi:hypothetical protein
VRRSPSGLRCGVAVWEAPEATLPRPLFSTAAPRPPRTPRAGPLALWLGFAAGLALALAPAPPAGAAPVFASEVVSMTNATAFRGGNVLGAPDRAGLFLRSTDPEAPLGVLVLRLALGAISGEGPDLVVFDEHRFDLEEDEEAEIAVSADGLNFMAIGSVFGGELGGEVEFPTAMVNPVHFVKITQLTSFALDVDAVQANFAVPEPGSLGLLAAGLALLARPRRSGPARSGP